VIMMKRILQSVLLCLMTGCILFHEQAFVTAKVQKRVAADGTIEYYNTKTPSRFYKVRKKKIKFKSKFNPLIEKIAKAKGVDPYLVQCVVKVESNFNPDALSPAGAMGLMQIMQATGRYYDLENPFDPEENLTVGITHLASLLKKLGGDIPLALAAYHAGLGRVKKSMSIPPIKSTIAYVNKIMYYYHGKKDYSCIVKRLYQRIDKDGTLHIYSK
jgi:soluble lytic murein transglycosylase-like protein